MLNYIAGNKGICPLLSAMFFYATKGSQQSDYQQFANQLL